MSQCLLRCNISAPVKNNPKHISYKFNLIETKKNQQQWLAKLLAELIVFLYYPYIE
jgi:hypothetical protein